MTISGTPSLATTSLLEDYIDLETWARKSNIHFHMETLNYIYTANHDISPHTIAESFIVKMPIKFEHQRKLPTSQPSQKDVYWWSQIIVRIH